MHRRRFFRTSALTAAALPLAPGLLASPAARAFVADGQRTAVRRFVGAYTNRGGTIGFLDTPDAIVVVDTQFPDAAQAFAAEMDAAGRRIDVLINTHHHGDHTGGNAVLAPLSDRFLAHERAPLLQRRAAEGQENPSVQAYATETFADTLSFDAGDETIHLKHYGPGHTGGDAVVFFENANVVHMGDLVFNRRAPYIDVNGGEADTDNWQRALGLVHDEADADTLFLFGHSGDGYGIVGTRSDLAVMREYFGALVAHVTDGMAAGKTLDELKVDVLPAMPDFATGRGLDSNIEAVWKERGGAG